MGHSFSPQLSHMGISCFDVENMLTFYTGVFNFKLTDKGHGRNFPYLLAFLSASPKQHHQLVLAQNRAPGTPSTVMQLSFLVNTLSELREAKSRALAHGATHLRGLSHGNALSIYFSDPEDNTVESTWTRLGMSLSPTATPWIWICPTTRFGHKLKKSFALTPPSCPPRHG